MTVHLNSCQISEKSPGYLFVRVRRLVKTFPQTFKAMHDEVFAINNSVIPAPSEFSIASERQGSPRLRGIHSTTFVRTWDWSCNRPLLTQRRCLESPGKNIPKCPSKYRDDHTIVFRPSVLIDASFTSLVPHVLWRHGLYSAICSHSGCHHF